MHFHSAIVDLYLNVTGVTRENVKLLKYTYKITPIMLKMLFSEMHILKIPGKAFTPPPPPDPRLQIMLMQRVFSIT